VISTHVLDTEHGRPAEGVRVELYRGDELLAAEKTDAEGRIKNLAEVPEPGTYRLVFLPVSSPFFRRVEIEVSLDDTGPVHIPLLLAPYGCTTYRGS
jgi:5-hydroxyisourate hydrolase